MASLVGALRVVLGADISGLQTGMKRAERQVAKSSGVMSRAVKDVNKSLSGLGSIGGVALGGAGLLAGVGAFLKVADAAKQIEAQLKLATREFGSFSKAQKDVQRISEVTRSGLVETANLYATFQRNAKELSLTQEESARATETVIKTFQISGATAEEAAGGLRQFLQALQSGQLRGEEFNSVMENAPRLAKLLADSLKVTIGELRAMAKEGEITGDKLKAALTDRKFTDQIDEEFKQLPVTFDQAMTQVYNSAVIVFSEFDKGGQFSNSIVSFVTDGTEGFKKLGESAEQFGSDVGDLFDALETIREALGSLQREGGLTFGLLEDSTLSWREALAETLTGIDAVINGVYRLGSAPSRALGGLFGKGSFGELFGEAPLPDGISDLRGSFDAKTGARDLDKRFRAAREAQSEGDVRLIELTVRKAAEDIRSKRASGQPIKQSELDNLRKLTTTLEAATPRTPPPFKAPPGKAEKPKKGKQPPRDRSDDVEFQFAQELRAAQIDVLRAQQSMAVTNDERARIALQLLDAERQGKEAELNDRVRRAERDFAEGKITEGALEQVKLQADKLRAEYDSVDAIERQAIANELAAKKAEDAAALVDADFDLQLEKAQIESSLADTAAERRDAELRILALAKEQEKARLEAVIADTESSKLAKEEAKLRLAKLDELYAGRADVARQGTRGAGEDYLASLPTDAAKMQEALDGVKVRGLQSLEQGILDVTTGVKSMGEAFKEVADQIIADLLRIAIQRAIIIPLANSLFPGSGGVAAGLAGGGGGTALFGPSNPGVGFAHGGGFNVKGIQGFDKNTLSLNGLPIANVSYGERVSVSNDNDGGYMSNGPLIGNITLPPGMTQREGRATGLAIGRGIQDRLGYTVTGRKR